MVFRPATLFGRRVMLTEIEETKLVGGGQRGGEMMGFPLGVTRLGKTKGPMQVGRFGGKFRL